MCASLFQPFKKFLVFFGCGFLVLIVLSFTSGRTLSSHAVKPIAALVNVGLPAWLTKNETVEKTQQIKDEALKALDDCTKIYFESKRFKIDVVYSVFYDSENFNKPSDKKSGKIIRNKDNFFQDEMGTIKILNKDHEFTLNERAEFITVRKRFKKEVESVNFQIDSLAKFITRVEKTEDGYFYFMEEGEIEKFEFIAYADGSLNIWRTYYRNKKDFGNGEVKVITQLQYLNFDKNTKVDSEIFSLEPYVSISKKGEVKAKGNYKNYYVLNQIGNL